MLTTVLVCDFPTILAKSVMPKSVQQETTVECSPTECMDFAARLHVLMNTACDFLAEPLRPLSENHAGYIEGISVDTEGNVWIVGWILRSLGHEFAVVIADNRKTVGAVSVMCYDRDDLPANAHAMTGLLRTDWRPNPESPDIFVFVVPGMKAHLRTIRPLKLINGKAIVEHIAQVQPTVTEGRVMALQSVLLGASSWLPDTARITGFTIEASVDEILILPDFGCLVQGWVISPAKPVCGLSLRLGERVLNSIPGSLSFRPRLDLVSVYPHASHLLRRAGFVVALEGPVGIHDLANPALKIHLVDGTSSNISLDPKVPTSDRPCGPDGRGAASISRTRTGNLLLSFREGSDRRDGHQV